MINNTGALHTTCPPPPPPPPRTGMLSLIYEDIATHHDLIVIRDANVNVETVWRDTACEQSTGLHELVDVWSKYDVSVFIGFSVICNM